MKMNILDWINIKRGKTPSVLLKTNDLKLVYYNWWECDPEKIWFTRFIRKNFGNRNCLYHLYSVYGKRGFLNKDSNKNKIFFVEKM